MKILVVLIIFVLTAGSQAIAGANGKIIPLADDVAPDPFNATYLIGQTAVCLTEGKCQMPAAFGSAAIIKTSVFGMPVYGDVDGDGDEDAAVFLAHDPGGSGTFFYLAVAVNIKGNYRGTNAVLLGDRITPKKICVANGVITGNYLGRRPKEPMAVSPSVDILKYMVLDRNTLKAVELHSDGKQIVGGWVIIGHEMRTFKPCPNRKELWLMGSSPALKEILAEHTSVQSRGIYVPIFMTLAGSYRKPPANGFGADFQDAFYVTSLIKVFPQGNCKSDLIYMDSPLPGAQVVSPLKIRGYARGNWFFEGDFPVVLEEVSGKVIANGYATAKGEWMTEKFIPFESVMTFSLPDSATKGILILKKDNPTDQPEFDEALEIPVFFK